MKIIKIGLMGVLMMLVSSVMTMRVDAAWSNGFEYSKDGKETSTDTAKGLGDESQMLNYFVEERTSNGAKSYTLKDYLSSSDSYYTIPGLNNTNVLGANCETMVPQGICRIEEYGYVLITAYDSSRNYESVIYVLDTDGVLQATIVYCNKGHLGGITFDGSYVWIAEGSGADEGKNYVGAIGKKTIKNAVKELQDNGALSIALREDTHVKRQQLPALDSTSYCTYFDGRLWVGIFNEDTVSDIYGYKIDYRYSTPKLNIDAYIEAPKQTQGISFYKYYGTVYLGVSTSYGRTNGSIIRCYKPKYNYTKTYYDPRHRVVLSQIIKNDAYRTIYMPSMSEQISVHGVSMYCIFESAADKYLNGKVKSRSPMGSFCLFSAYKIFK